MGSAKRSDDRRRYSSSPSIELGNRVVTVDTLQSRWFSRAAYFQTPDVGLCQAEVARQRDLVGGPPPVASTCGLGEDLQRNGTSGHGGR
jgi:hypothetical protein